MNCPKCGTHWPADVRYCGACGAAMLPSGPQRSTAEAETIAKVRALLPEIGVRRPIEPTPGVFVIPKGSTHMELRVVGKSFGHAAIRSTALVTTGTSITQELLDYLLKENASFMLGGFAVGSRNEILFIHTIMASSVDAVELGASVSAVVNTADKYDDEIVRRWGGKTARDISVRSAIEGVFGEAIAKALGDIVKRPNPVRRSTGAPSPRHRPAASHLPEAIKVGSVAEEYAHLQAQRCTCGGSYKKEAQVVTELGGRFFDRLEVSCSRCNSRKQFLFDINSFFGATR